MIAKCHPKYQLQIDEELFYNLWAKTVKRSKEGLARSDMLRHFRLADIEDLIYIENCTWPSDNVRPGVLWGPGRVPYLYFPLEGGGYDLLLHKVVYWQMRRRFWPQRYRTRTGQLYSGVQGTVPVWNPTVEKYSFMMIDAASTWLMIFMLFYVFFSIVTSLS